MFQPWGRCLGSEAWYLIHVEVKSVSITLLHLGYGYTCDPKPVGSGETQLVDKPPCFRLPLDCYDTGDGYFDPEAGKVFAYEETDKDGERVVVREPTSTEVDWIKSKCRVGTL